MDYAKEALRLHREWKGKIEVVATVPAGNKEELSVAYTPGGPALPGDPKGPQPELRAHPAAQPGGGHHRRHRRAGPGGHRPRGRDAGDGGQVRPVQDLRRHRRVPLCVRTKDVDEFVQTVYNISGSFGGINLEDISAPPLL